MKTITLTLALTAAGMLLASPVLADSCCPTLTDNLAAAQSGPSASGTAMEKASPKSAVAGGKEKAVKAKDKGMKEMEEMKAAAPAEEKSKDFYKETKDGYTYRYEALPMSVKGATHHLMVYVTDKDGKPVSGAKVGYSVTGPDKRVQQVMAMEMGDGYGANLDLTVKGKYTFRTKATLGGLLKVSINHEFVKEIQ